MCIGINTFVSVVVFDVFSLSASSPPSQSNSIWESCIRDLAKKLTWPSLPTTWRILPGVLSIDLFLFWPKIIQQMSKYCLLQKSKETFFGTLNISPINQKQVKMLIKTAKKMGGDLVLGLGTFHPAACLTLMSGSRAVLLAIWANISQLCWEIHHVIWVNIS